MRTFTFGLAFLAALTLTACGGEGGGGGGPEGKYNIDRDHLEKAAMEQAKKEMPEGMEMPPEMMTMMKQMLAKFTIEVDVQSGGNWVVKGNAGDGDKLDETGTWTISGDQITFTTTKKDGKEHKSSKTGTYKNGVIMLKPDAEGPEMRFVRK